MLTCTLQHIFLDCFQDFLYFLHKLIKCNSIFLSCITTADHSLTILDILRAALDTDRNTTHFLLCEFESRALVCVVYFYADSCCLKNALFSLLDRDDHCLYRSDSRRQYQTAVITMYHDDCTDHTCCHAPGCLMYILKFIFFICILDAECSCKSIAKVMACTGLKSFSIMHQGFNCISSFCTGEFLLVCFLSLDNRDCKYFLAEICIQVQHLDSTLFCFLGCSMSCMAFLP